MRSIKVARLPNGFYELQGMFPPIPEIPYEVSPVYALEPMAASHAFMYGRCGADWYRVPKCMAATGLILPAPSLADWAATDGAMLAVAKVLQNAHIEYTGSAWRQVSGAHDPLSGSCDVAGGTPPFGANGYLACRRVLRIAGGKYYDSALVWNGVT